MPGIQGGPLMHTIAAKAGSFRERNFRIHAICKVSYHQCKSNGGSV